MKKLLIAAAVTTHSSVALASILKPCLADHLEFEY
jgi:hypothetical protein